jgi:predicted P-loop ATPase/GTPase
LHFDTTVKLVEIGVLVIEDAVDVEELEARRKA